MKDESAADPPLDQGSGPAQQPGETLTERRLVTRHRRVRRPLGAGYWLTALAVAAALVAATTYTQRDGVESALAADVDKRLAARGLGKVEVTRPGAGGHRSRPRGRGHREVARTVTGVTGVADVETTQSFASAEQRRTCQALGRELDRATKDQRIPFVGETARLTPEGLSLVKAAAQVLKALPRRRRRRRGALRRRHPRRVDAVPAAGPPHGGPARGRRSRLRAPGGAGVRRPVPRRRCRHDRGPAAQPTRRDQCGGQLRVALVRRGRVPRARLLRRGSGRGRRRAGASAS